MEKAPFPFSADDFCKTSAMPKYLQLYQLLKEYVGTPDGQTGKLPGELELCRIFGISRKTVGNALALLAEEHLICRIKHRGTFPAALVPPTDPQSPSQKIGIAFPYTLAWGELLKPMREAIARLKYDLELRTFSWRNFSEVPHILRRIRKECVGMILYPTFDPGFDRFLREFENDRYPVIVFDLCRREEACDMVSVDHFLAGFRLTETLLNTGCRMPGFLQMPPHIKSSKPRFEGYCTALEKYGVLFSGERVFQISEKEDSSAALAAFLESAPIDSLVSNLMSQHRSLSLSRPKFMNPLLRRALPVAGFDIPPSTWRDQPWLRLVANQQKNELGLELVQLLKRRLEFPASPYRKVLLNPCILVANGGIH